MKFERTEVWGFEHTIRGMRNPLESWDRSDSFECCNAIQQLQDPNCIKCKYNRGNYCEKGKEDHTFIIGSNDLELMQKLIKAGSEHRKFMRQIFVSVDITAPSYFFAELDTYKIGTVRNSTSMQHKGVSHRYTIDDFEVDEEIKEVLRIKEKELKSIIYPYETTEYKFYTCENGRKYKVFRNGKLYSCPYDLTDNTGRIRHFEEKEIIPSQTKSGYFVVNIGGRNGEKWLLHRLVASVWLNNEHNFETVDHKKGNKSDNSAENLEWVSREENIKREWDNFKGFDLQKCYKNWKLSSKINPVERIKIRELWENGISQKEIASTFEIKQSQVSVICRDDKSTFENKELFEHCWYWEQILNSLNLLREKYLDTKDYKYFRLIRQLMPMGYLYTSTVTMSYENLLNMYRQRCVHPHKLNEWSGKENSSVPNFKNWVESLPYAKELICLGE